MKYIYFFMIITFFSIPVSASQEVNKFVVFNGFELEKTELKEIISVLGNAEIYHEGDAGDSYTAICYYYPKQNVSVLYESGEMGGSTTLLSHKFHSGKFEKFTCATKNDGGVQKFEISSLRIGQPLKIALASLPTNPNSVSGTSYLYLNTIPFTENDFIKANVNRSEHAVWDEAVTIELYEKKGVVTGFGVSKIRTY